MPGGAKKKNKNAKRAGADGVSSKRFEMTLTPREQAQLKEMALLLNVSDAQLVRQAVSDYRVRLIGGGLKLKK